MNDFSQIFNSQSTLRLPFLALSMIVIKFYKTWGQILQRLNRSSL